MADLRTLNPDDWRVWREVRLAALADAPEAFGANLAYWSGPGDTEERWRSRLTDVPFNVVSSDGDHPTGQVSGTALDGDGRVELISMWVAPDARGTGVAGALVGSVVEWAQEQGATAVHLSVRVGNERALGLYVRAGFAVVGEPAGDPAEITMVQRLASSEDDHA